MPPPPPIFVSVDSKQFNFLVSRLESATSGRFLQVLILKSLKVDIIGAEIRRLEFQQRRDWKRDVFFPPCKGQSCWAPPFATFAGLYALGG
jgi:hypothetical protein